MKGNFKNHMVKTIAVASGKGGVGKTNVVTNLGIALKKLGREVLIFDADMGLSNIDVLLSLAPKYNIEHVLKGQKNLKDIIIEGPLGVKILPAGVGVQELTSLKSYERVKILEEFEDYNENIDIMLIDTSAGISENVSFFCSAAQDIIILTTPEPTSITDAYALIKVLYNKYREDRFNLVVNLVKNEDEAKEIFKRLYLVSEKFLGVKLSYLGFVRYDENLKKAVKAQNAFINLYPNSIATKDIFQIASSILDSEINFKGNIQFFLRNALSGYKEETHV